MKSGENGLIAVMTPPGPREVLLTTAPAGFSSEMTYDRHRDRTVVFAWSPQAEVIEFDGNEWIRTPVVGTHPLPPIALGFDRHGGSVIAAAANGTWNWDGNAWTQVAAPANSPPSRMWAGLVHDGQRLLLAGGRDAAFVDPAPCQ